MWVPIMYVIYLNSVLWLYSSPNPDERSSKLIKMCMCSSGSTNSKSFKAAALFTQGFAYQAICKLLNSLIGRCWWGCWLVWPTHINQNWKKTPLFSPKKILELNVKDKALNNNGLYLMPSTAQVSLLFSNRHSCHFHSQWPYCVANVQYMCPFVP